jgi:hypothetical protein
MGWIGAAATLGAVLLLVHLDLLRGRLAPNWDAFDFFAPYHLLVGDFARAGQFLFWNPFVHGGSPDYIEPQVGAFSPLVLLFSIAGGRHSFDFYWLTVWYAGGAGVLLLARRLGAPWWGGLVVALGFVFSGVYTGNAEHTATLAATSYLPLVLWRVEAALADRSLRPAVEAGALWGLSALAGYPGLIMLDAAFVTLWCVGRWAFRDRTDAPASSDARITAPWAFTVLAVMAIVGITVLAPTFVAFLIEGRGYSDRAGPLAREVAVDHNALHPTALITAASPFLPLAEIYGGTDISLRSIYAGVLTPLLAALALGDRRRSRFAWWLLLVGVGFLLMAMGSVLPLRGWLYDWVPPTRYFRNSAIFRGYFLFALTALGLFGTIRLHDILRDRRDKGWRAFVMTGAGVAALGLTIYLTATALLDVSHLTPFLDRSRTIEPGEARLHAWVSWLSVALCPIAGSLVGWRARSWLVPAALTVTAVAGASWTARISSPVMYYGETTRWRAIDFLHRNSIDLTAGGLTRVAEGDGNRTFYEKRAALKGYGPLQSVYHNTYENDPLLAATATGSERLWFSPVTVTAGRSQACFDAFRKRLAALGAPPLVTHSPESMRHASGDADTRRCVSEVSAATAATRLHGADVQVVRYAPTRLTLRITVPGHGWLMVTDTWAGGWHATVNGKAVTVSGANFAFRAVPVTSGVNEVDFRYEAWGYPWLLIGSWTTLAGVLLWAVTAAVQRHRRALIPASATTESVRP